MLEKNEKNSYFDAHFHLADCLDLKRDSRVKPGNDTTDDLSLSGLTRQSLIHIISEYEILFQTIYRAELRQAPGLYAAGRNSYGRIRFNSR